jgi:hypothetical protein
MNPPINRLAPFGIFATASSAWVVCIGQLHHRGHNRGSALPGPDRAANQSGFGKSL